ncbi:HST2 [Candida oxycetoniae]|uniref:NAD-dependent protein deacetylase n=1 Tax=Candida oxycetoniae TaxID=497107 RepID=A0AAI9SVR9_9ASCO|nr:HST2 [Candida oxycetoniae]KAI3403993.2 HST2 [Candida oxycetoniae]
MVDLDLKLKPVADAIKDGKKVTFFNGAGISTSAGIPDFRSPETGLYSQLAKLDLPFAEAVFDIDYFKENPKPFYTLAHELYPGKFPPTKFHHFIKLVQDRGQLKRVYTQNIDTLERLAGVKDEYIVEAHGSFAKNHCVECFEEMSISTLEQHMKDEKKNGIPTCEKCQGYVKPNIVFFGEGLPAKFFETWKKDRDQVELAIISGTSLTVYPFASLPFEVSKKCTRVLINKEKVGDIGSRKSDVLALKDCDSVVDVLASLLGWKDELDVLYEAGKKKCQVSKAKAKAKADHDELETDNDKSKREQDEEKKPVEDQEEEKKPAEDQEEIVDGKKEHLSELIDKLKI